MNHLARKNTIKVLSKDKIDITKLEYTTAQNSLSQGQNLTSGLYNKAADIKNTIDNLFEKVKHESLFEVKYHDGSDLNTDHSNKVLQELDWLRTDFLPELKTCIDCEKHTIKE